MARRVGRPRNPVDYTGETLARLERVDGAGYVFESKRTAMIETVADLVAVDPALAARVAEAIEILTDAIVAADLAHDRDVESNEAEIETIREEETAPLRRLLERLGVDPDSASARMAAESLSLFPEGVRS
jgi:hypothetical protein